MDVELLGKERLSAIFGCNINDLRSNTKLQDIPSTITKSDWVASDWELIEDDLREAVGEVKQWREEVLTVGDYCRVLGDFWINNETGFKEMQNKWRQTSSTTNRLSRQRKVKVLTAIVILAVVGFFLYVKFFK